MKTLISHEAVLTFLLAIMHNCRADLTLVHEVGGGGHGKIWTGWGYTLLPSTFPLSWDEAREACEVIPGSMLARVEDWEGEAALAEYLKTVHMKEPIWLANRQTLPEVLQNEQEQMNHLPHRATEGEDLEGNPGESEGTISMAGVDLTVGGDVGVTLRCAIYILGVGIVHELCSSRSVSAALCVQRLSSDRPLSKICPPSVHHTWLLVNRQIEFPGDEDTAVTIIGLQPCHHHQLGQTYCHLKNGWSKTVCPTITVDNQQVKHHKSKNHHKYHHGVSHSHFRQSRKGPKAYKAEKPITLEHNYERLFTSDNRRNKREADDDDKGHSLTDFLRLHRSQAMMRLGPSLSPLPLTKDEGLNLDLIESIMKDLAEPKKPKKDKQNKKDRRERRRKERKNRTTSTPSPQTVVEDMDDKEIPNIEMDASVKTPSSTVSTIKTETPTKDNTESKPINNENTSEDISMDPVEKDKVNEVDNVEKEQPIEGEKEESGPSLTVGVGPIFVSDVLTETPIIEAAVAEEPMDESLTGEEVLMDIHNTQDSPNQGESEAPKDQAILFPEIPKGVIPDPTPRINLDEQMEVTSAMAIEDIMIPTTEQEESNVEEELITEESAPSRPRADFNEIFFPQDDDQDVIIEAAVDSSQTSSDGGMMENVIPDESKDEAAMEKPDMDEQTEVPSEGAIIPSVLEEGQSMDSNEEKDMTNKEMEEENMVEIKDEEQDMTNKDMVEENMPETKDEEVMLEMEAEEGVPEMGDKSDMQEMENNEEMPDMDDESDMPEMEEESVQTEEMENEGRDEESLNDDKMKENMENNDGTGNLSEEEESEEDNSATEVVDDAAIEIIVQQNREEEELSKRPSNIGKTALLGQILQGIFG